MGKSQRTKGANAERQAARELEERFGRSWRRSASQSQGRYRARQEPDVVLVHPASAWEAAQGPEVKYGAAPPVWAGLRQAVADAGDGERIPWVMARSQREPWTAWIPLDRLAEVACLLLGCCGEARLWDGWEARPVGYRAAWRRMRARGGPVLVTPPEDLAALDPIVGLRMHQIAALVEMDWAATVGDALECDHD